MPQTSILKEYALSVNEFNQPAEARGKKAIGVFLIRLLLMDKGTDPMRPDMGVGIVSRYRYMFEETCSELISDIRNQIQTYLLPYSNFLVDAKVEDKELHLTVTIDDETYSYKSINLNSENMTLIEVMNDGSLDGGE